MVAARSHSIAFVLSAVGAWGLASSNARAQMGSGVFRWELSGDGGATWHGGDLEVPLAQRVVKVRARLEWTPDAGFYRNISCDVVISNVGFADIVSNIDPGVSILPVTDWPVAMRMGELIKIDDRRDTELPGLGAYWHSATSREYGIPTGGEQSPMNGLLFDLNLDGQPGRRQIGHVFREWEVSGRIGPLLMLSSWGPPAVYNLPEFTALGASFTVIPAAITLTPVVGAVLFASRRRSSGRSVLR